jgi:hypothetical protein
VPVEHTQHNTGIEFVFVNGIKRGKNLLYQVSLLSVAVFLETNPVAVNYGVINLPRYPSWSSGS